jgi:hypothetical protein
MANHGTPLTTKNLKKFAGTVVLNIPEIDNDLAGDLGNNGDAVSLILKVAFTRANLDEALVKLGKVAEPKPIPSVLKLVTTVTLPARAEKFVPKKSFVENTKPGAHVKFAWVDPDFIRWFGDKTEEPTAEATLRQHVLTCPSVFAPAMKEIRDGGVATKTTPGELYSLLEKQPDGPKSAAGPLLTNGYANLFEMDDVNGVARLVSALWDDGNGGWLVCANDASYSVQGRVEDQVFSRDSRLPSAA